MPSASPDLTFDGTSVPVYADYDHPNEPGDDIGQYFRFHPEGWTVWTVGQSLDPLMMLE